MRPLVSLVLTLCLIFGSVAEAVARHQMDGAGGQVICGGDASGLILDANGAPVTPHPCNHCLAAAIAAVLPAAPQPTAPVTIRAADPVPMLPPPAGITPLAKPHARGPPSVPV